MHYKEWISLWFSKLHKASAGKGKLDMKHVTVNGHFTAFILMTTIVLFK